MVFAAFRVFATSGLCTVRIILLMTTRQYGVLPTTVLWQACVRDHTVVRGPPVISRGGSVSYTFNLTVTGERVSDYPLLVLIS